MLIESFLYSIIEKNDAETLFKVKDYFLVPKEKPYVDFVKDFYANYAKLPDLTTVEQKFKIQLQDNTESTDYWYKELVDKYKKKIIDETIINSAKNKSQALDNFQQAIIDSNTDIDSKVLIYSDGASRAKDYDERKKNKGITHMSSGNADLDLFSLGYKKADLWTIGGREGIGKTWLLLRMAMWLDMYLLSKYITRPILIISGEMDAEELGERLDAMRCEISYNRLSRGDLTPIEERKFKRFLRGFFSNIKIIDTFDNLKDIEYFISIYRPVAVFIDGSHLLAKSYEWVDVARVTATMKRITRNNKVPIINTTHLKAEKGKSAKGGDLDDFAYTKGYTRDSDIVGVMFASDLMELENKFGIDWVKVRRGNKARLIWQNDYETSKMDLFESLTGAQLAAAKVSNSSGGSGGGMPLPPPATGRRGAQTNGGGLYGNDQDDDD